MDKSTGTGAVSDASRTDTFERDAVIVNRRSPLGSRAFAALLPFCVLLFLCACGAVPDAEGGDPSRKDPKGASDAEIARAAQGTNTTDTVAEQAVEAAFVHRATDENSRGDYTYLDDPSINGDADAAVFATPTSDRGVRSTAPTTTTSVSGTNPGPRNGRSSTRIGRR